MYTFFWFHSSVPCVSYVICSHLYQCTGCLPQDLCSCQTHEIWTPEEPSLAENYCQNERNSPSPQSQGTSNFNEQFKQRKGQRKAKTDTQTDVIQPQNRSDFSNDTPRTIQNLSQKSHNHDQKEPFQDGVEPKIHQRVQVFAQGRHVRSLRDVKIKRIKLIVIWTQYHTIQITSNTKVKSRNRI